MSTLTGAPSSRLLSSAEFDQPWRRLLWIIPTAVLIWTAALIAFGFMLESASPPPPELAPTEVRIVELPPAAGLQASPAKAAPAPVKRITPPVPHAPIHHLAKPRLMPTAPPSANGTAKPTKEAPPAPASSAKSAPASATSGPPAVAGLGSDSDGARAILAPTPVIPDELRDEALQTVAVAHFKVGYDGAVQVTLTQATSSSRLNRLLLETLQQWRFFPARKNGVAINSEFDVRIPITVE